MKALEGRGVSCLEMPLIETAPGPDTDRLPDVLRREGHNFDWVCITSPEAASVFIEGWKKAGCPAVRVAVVGDGTGRVLRAAEEPTLVPQFTPSVANADHFGPELPILENGTKKVLYPASNKASSVLQEGLLARGFDVVRLNTYDTLPVTTLADDQLELAKQAEVVAIASPSAVRAWLKFVGDEAAEDVAIACIGSTSGQAAKKLGLARVFYPEEPSLDNFVTTIIQALEACGHHAGGD
jgi:uroporphyrinogen-III synthase